ncbi:MAG TPA: TonB family protein [Bryobacteraceae bacterium]|nr:TonB family protein [Bryobacteraceae bacterium]
MPHTDVLEERESLRISFLSALGLHAGIATAIAAAAWMAAQNPTRWGDPNSLGGGTVGITPVQKIPMPARVGPTNPVANDTENTIPPPPKPKAHTQQEPEPDAIPIKSRNVKRSVQESAAIEQKYRPEQITRPNQVTSSTGQAAVSPLFTPTPGGGGIGSGSANPFGYGFGWYAALVRERVARAWNRQGLDPRARPVTVFFDIYRDGSVRDARVMQSSGNFAVDQSALRAVVSAGPLQPLPPQLPKNVYTVSLEFRLSQ